MAIHRSWSVFGVAALLAAIVVLLLPVARSSAQVQEGATMTVLRGQVAVVRSDGSAVQPAPSGTLVYPGDEIRTLGSTSALITFFSGTEIELEQNTSIAIDHVSKQGDRVDISLRQVIGATVNRVQTLTGSGSTYRIEAGGAVALVRGTTFVMIGPVTTSAGTVVIVVCGADCSAASTFAGCPLGPFLGYGVLVDKGQVESACIPFAVSRTADLVSQAFEAITTIEQAVQGDTRGVPPGQVQSGQQQEIETRSRRRDDEDEDDPVDTSASQGGEPTLSIDDVTVTEGGSATFTVSLSPTSSQPVTVNYATANGTAVAPADYTPASGTLTFPPGSTTRTIVVPTVADLVVEPNETFAINLSGASGATIADPQGVGTIAEPTALTLSIDDVTATEGTNAIFTVRLSAASSQPVTVNYATANGTAVAPGDYTPASGTVTFPPGTTTQTITIPILNDTTSPTTVRATAVEPPETFVVTLSGASGATIADGQAVITIVDPIALTLSIGDVSATEGGNATFTVTMSALSSQPVTVNFATANGTAAAPSDYAAASGSVTIPAGSTTATIVIPTVADTIDELDEAFVVNLSGASGATIADSQGIGTIVDDDTAALSINDVSQNEGNDCTEEFEGFPVYSPCGTTPFVFTVTLSTPSDRTVTVDFATGGGTATAGPAGSCELQSFEGDTDYETTSGTLSFEPGTPLTRTITVPVCADNAFFFLGSPEGTQTFLVNLTNPTGGAAIADPQAVGTIVEDDTELIGT